MVEKAQKEVENMIREEGEAATLEVGVHGIHPELVRLLGRMKFRTSYGQNALKHSIEVAQLSGLLAGEIGVMSAWQNVPDFCMISENPSTMRLKVPISRLVLIFVRNTKNLRLSSMRWEAHHGDVEPESLIACIVQAADTISAARPGARRETRDLHKSFETVRRYYQLLQGSRQIVCYPGRTRFVSW